MPHEALDSVTRTGARRPEVVLGDRFGAAASTEVVETLEAGFAAAGLVVSRNAPFAGAYVTQAYGRPQQNRHAIQIEIDRSLYMNEALIRPNGISKRSGRLCPRCWPMSSAVLARRCRWRRNSSHQSN